LEAQDSIVGFIRPWTLQLQWLASVFGCLYKFLSIDFD